MFYQDSDGDHFGDPLVTQTHCTAPSGWNADNTDCDDTSAAINPNAVELCFDGLDNDCVNGADGSDASDSTTWYVDSDGDGYGDANGSSMQQACEQPTGYVDNYTDCVDSAANIYPGAAQNDDPTLCMQDADGDGYGNLEAISNFPSAVGLSNGSDCDDSDANTYIGAAEFSPSYCMEDADDDGHGAAVTTGTANKLGNDCDDTHNQTYPGAAESETAECMRDADYDGWGDKHVSADVVAGNDCNDADGTIYPFASETIDDGIDQDCDGADLESYFTIDAGAQTTCGLNSFGEPSCWGRNDASNPDDLVLNTPSTGGYSEIAVSWVDEVACAVDASTSLLDCWGLSSQPIRTDLNSTTPLYGVALGIDIACGIDTNTYEDITCWGAPCPTTICQLPPTAQWSDSTTSIPLYDTWNKIVLNSEHVGCAISDLYGVLECWGDTNSQIYTHAPAEPSTFDISNNFHFHYIDIAMSQVVGCAIYNSYWGSVPTLGSIECWGDTTNTIYTNAPTTSNWLKLSCSETYCCATDGGINTECWGDVPTLAANTPSPDYSPLAPGFQHLCGLDGDGVIECWGDNADQQCDHP